MATNRICCGCHTSADYGTSLAQGTGSVSDPFTVEQIDPEYIRPVVRVRRNSTFQNIAAGVQTVVSFDTEEFDSANMWAIGLPTQVFFPIIGLYIVGAETEFTSIVAVGDREITLRLNGITNFNSIEGEGDDNFQIATFDQVVINSITDYMEVVIRSDATVDTKTTLWACYMGKKV